MSPRLTALAGLLLLLLLPPAGAVESGDGEEAPLRVRVFTLHYRPVEDVPGESPYALYRVLPYPQHVKGPKGE